MQALTIYQPWAELIICGKKSIEVRTFWPRVQLPMLVAIHAGLTIDRTAPHDVCELAAPDARNAFRRGGIIGMARLVERIGFGDYGEIEGRAMWERLVNQHLNPADGWAKNKVGFRFDYPVCFPDLIPCRGKQGLWALPDDTAEEVEKAIGR